MPNDVVEVFVLLDFDRTLGDTDAIVAEYEKSADEQSFLRTMQQKRTKNPEYCLAPHARDLLDYLNTHAIPYGVLTYGEEAWQSLKMRAVGLDDIPVIVTDNEKKGELIATWQADDHIKIPKAYSTKPLLARKVVFIDDKLQNFDGAPERCMCLWYSPLNTGKQATIVNDYTEIKDLQNVLRYL